MSVTSAKIHPPASLRSDGDRHQPRTGDRDEIGIADRLHRNSQQSAGSRFALWFGGIHGDKKLGMEQVAQTAKNGRYLRPFAKIILALAARRENQNALAQRLLLELKEQYPDNVLFASEYAKAMDQTPGKKGGRIRISQGAS